MGLLKARTEAPVSPEPVGPEADCAGLELALDSPEPTARRWAAGHLTRCGGASTAIVTRLRRETVPAVREALLCALTTLGDATAVDGLVECLRSEDTALRNEAIGAMQQLPAAVAGIMPGLLRDEDPDVRIFAVNVLESLRHPGVEGWLIDVVTHDQHLNVCAAAVDLLGEVGSPLAREPLQQLQARFRDTPYIQFATDVALSRIVAA
jgi:HEAT repeat protein